MKTYHIVLLDKITKKTEKIQTFQESENQNLKQKLLYLQKGYCVDEKPSVSIQTITSNNKKYCIAIAECNSDFSYFSVLKKLKS